MKLEMPEQDVKMSGDFDSQDFAIGDIAFIVDMFADKVYSHKERAVIRELSCNAYDSHVMAGTQSVPFDVNIPTYIDPTFSIRDYGTGLSDHEVRTIFSGIGISTKRDNNDVIGCFGIGSLSPFSLTDSFSVTSWHNGVCNTYLCHRDEQRKPVVTRLSTEKSDEPNGLEIKFTIDGRCATFESEAKFVFKYWDGTIPNINSENVKEYIHNHRENYYHIITDDFAFRNEYGNVYAVMGNVAYNIPATICSLSCVGYIKFDLGELDFDTSRENLSLTDKTRAAVEQKIQQIKNTIATLIVDQIEQQPTLFTKCKKHHELTSSGALNGFVTYKISSKYQLPSTTDSFKKYAPQWRGVDELHIKRIPIGTKAEYYLYKPSKQNRIKYHVRTNQIAVIVFSDQKQAAEAGLDLHLLKDLNDLPPAPRSNAAKTYSTVKTYEYNNGISEDSTSWKEVTLDTDPSNEIVYIEINRWVPQSTSIISRDMYSIYYSLKSVKPYIGDVRLFGLKTAFTKTKAFEKGNFIHLDDYICREMKQFVPDTSLTINHNNKCFMDDIVKYIDSEELSEWTEFQFDTELHTICKSIGFNIKKDNSAQEWYDNFIKKYPMLKYMLDKSINNKVAQDIANYINGEVK